MKEERRRLTRSFLQCGHSDNCCRTSTTCCNVQTCFARTCFAQRTCAVTILACKFANANSGASFRICELSDCICNPNQPLLVPPGKLKKVPLFIRGNVFHILLLFCIICSIPTFGILIPILTRLVLFFNNCLPPSTLCGTTCFYSLLNP
jgi:hypothetical protein